MIVALRVFSCSGSAFRPLTARTSMVPRVRAQIVPSPVMPRQTKSTLEESSASFITSLERNVAQVTFRSGMPASFASRSTIFLSSITIKVR
ncbi:MAG: hypothetical protein IPI73_14250 [Betaproteobacteria bacterium]|nr:hypothetical protein [Betaproteobacteria bacterium]